MTVWLETNGTLPTTGAMNAVTGVNLSCAKDSCTDGRAACKFTCMDVNGTTTESIADMIAR